MIYLRYFLIILLYSVALFSFGVYIRLTEITELFTCYACKEMDKLKSAYDYIIVGCGTAGSVVALRLAEDRRSTILILEAGPYGDTWFDIPAVAPLLQLSAVDWQYRTISQKNAAKAFRKQESSWPMGRIVGGTGRINNMVYMRGHPSDFNEWYKDAEDYDFETDILSYFKKAENHRGAYKNDTKFHSTSGHLIIEDLSFVSPLASAFLEAAKILGFPVRDLNGRYNTGFMQTQANIDSGVRWMPAHHLLSRNKPNVILQTNTFVHKVLLKAAYEAYGVECTYLGEKLSIRARKGIILSAGAVGTPKILMLSGIGPREHLDNVRIKTKIDLPVGNNLQDHVATGSDLVILNTTLGINPFTMLSPASVFSYFHNSSGPWTTIGCEVMGIIDINSKTYCYDELHSLKLASLSRIKAQKQKTSWSKRSVRSKAVRNLTHKSQDILDKYLPKAQRYKSPKIVTDAKYNVTNEVCPPDESRQPDLGFMVVPLGASTDDGKHLRKAAGLTEKTWNRYFAPLVMETVISILPIVLHPKSRGTVRLGDNNWNSAPVINPNYLSNSYDVEILLKGIDLIKKFIATEPMQKLGARLNKQKFPGCEDLEFDTRLYWECYVRHYTITVYHPVGTCKMGSGSAKDTVVDYDFRVHNTNNLYVADASVMPSLPSSNPNAAVAMIAEKAAAKLKYYEFLNKSACNRTDVFRFKSACRAVK